LIEKNGGHHSLYISTRGHFGSQKMGVYANTFSWQLKNDFKGKKGQNHVSV
jgi:hypothetical protein